MAATAQKIEETCQLIMHNVQAFGADTQRVAELRRALEALRWLRGEYRRDKPAMATHLDRLRECGKAVQDCISAGRETLAGKYLEAAQAASAWEAIREDCREALVELAVAESAQRFDSPTGWIEVRAVSSMSLPKSGTAHRDELTSLLDETGRWPQVAVPNAARLLKAMKDGLFTPDQAARLSAICPVQTTYRFQSHGK